MPKLNRILSYEPGLEGIVSPKPGIVKPEIIRTVDMPFASRTSPGTGKPQRGMMTRCTEHGATLAKRREVLTFIETVTFTLTDADPIHVFFQEPQIDAFSFWFTDGIVPSNVEWKFDLGPTIYAVFIPSVNYFRVIRAETLTFARVEIFSDNCEAEFKTYRYQ